MTCFTVDEGDSYRFSFGALSSDKFGAITGFVCSVSGQYALMMRQRPLIAIAVTVAFVAGLAGLVVWASRESSNAAGEAEAVVFELQEAFGVGGDRPTAAAVHAAAWSGANLDLPEIDGVQLAGFSSSPDSDTLIEYRGAARAASWCFSVRYRDHTPPTVTKQRC
ncbi:MAG TPA: hypothetical protein VF183_09300 [Acidimicrobiales bacterium]